MKTIVVPRVGVLCAFVCVVLLAQARQVEWTGAAGPVDGVYSWTDGGNWKGGSKPATDDVAVFKVSGSITINTQRISGQYNQIGGMRFEEGTVNFTANSEFYLSAATNEFYVAAAAAASMTNAVDGWGGDYTKTILKTGPGTLQCMKLGVAKKLAAVVVDEGVFASMDSTSRFNVRDIDIHRGATFFVNGYHVFHPDAIHPNVNVETGGIFRMNASWGNNYIDRLEGAGEVVDTSGQSSLIVNPSRDCTFSGTFNNRVNVSVSAGSTGRFIIGGKDVMRDARTFTGSARVCFASGVDGTFDLGTYSCNRGYPLCIEDVDGGPVKVTGSVSTGLETFSVTGCGEFWTRASICLTNTQVGAVGTLKATSGTLTLGDGTAAGDVDFSTIGALDATGGNLTLRNNGKTTFDGPVTGTGTLTTRGDVTLGDLSIDGGSVAVGGVLEMTGGRLRTRDGISPASGSTAADPSVFRMNGGELLVKADKPSTYTYTPFSSSSAMRVEIGPRGATLGQDAAYGTFHGVSISVAQELTGAADGGVRQYGYRPWSYNLPLSITGPFVGEGGVSVVSGSLSSAPRYFGAGAMTLRNNRISVASQGSAAAMSLPGAGQTLTVEGGSALALRTDSSHATVSATIEALAFDKGGVLFLRDAKGSIGDDGMAKVVVAGGVATNASNGRVLVPVLGTSTGAQDAYFLTYDPEAGFRKISLTSESALASTDSNQIVQVSSGWTTVPENSMRAADALKLVRNTTVKLNAGASLTLGDGTNPALLLLCGAYLQGDNTSSLHFGTSPGVVCVQGYMAGKGVMEANQLHVPIRTAAGLAYASYPGNDGDGIKRFVTVSGANSYSGETYVGAVGIVAQNINCFSYGKVNVTGGEAYGGQVRFNVQDGVWANDFCVSGWGVRDNQYEGHVYNGALSFSRNATLAGTVEIERLARLCAQPGVTGVVSGAVSGGRLQIYDSPGVVRLTADNAYSGGTEIVGGTLEIAAAGAAGIGAILLDGGTLRFVNNTPVTFTNAIEAGSAGRVEICGAPVTFADESWLKTLPFATLDEGTSFDYPALEEATWSPCVDGVLDLGGKAATVAALSGSGRVTGGVLTVTGRISPAGEGAVGTLTFDETPILSGATFVCDVNGGGADKIVVPGDFSLSSLSFETHCPRSPACSRMVVFGTEGGMLSGTFASEVQIGRPFLVGYSSTAVTLSKRGFVMMFR